MVTEKKTPEELLAEQKDAVFSEKMENVRTQQVQLVASLQAEYDMHMNAASALKLQLDSAKMALDEINARLPAPIIP